MDKRMEKIRISAVEKTINKSIMETFQAMLSMELTKVGQVTDPGLSARHMVSAVHYAGEVVGTLSLHISEEFARLVTSTMLGITSEEIESDDEVKDVLGEIANIVSGNLKSDFTDSQLACVISTPSITHGSDFKVTSASQGEFHQWIYRYQKNEIIVEISIKEDLGAKADIAGMNSLSVDEVIAKIRAVDVPTTVVNAVIDVFYTMLSMEIATIPKVPDSFKEEKRTVGSVSFAGDVNGIFMIQVNDTFAHTMAAAMLGIEENEIENEEEVFDVIREMSNIIGGNLKSSFVDAGVSCALSTPSITNGLDFHVEALNIIRTQRFLFEVQGNTVIVDAGIKKHDGDQEASSDVDEANQVSVPVKASQSNEDTYHNLDLIMEIPLEVTVELGTTTKRVRDLLKMGPGSVVGLSQLEGEPVNLLVNDTLVAKGEVQVDKEKYGIRIVEVVSRKARVKSLK
jgi:flagellar motor switch protein FliN